MSDLAVRQRTEPASPQEGHCKWCGEELPVDRRRDKVLCDSSCRAEYSLWKSGRQHNVPDTTGKPLKGAKGKPLTQRDRILYELRQAGDGGVRGDVFLRLMMPRYPARILDLRKEGFEIDSVQDEQYARYILRGEPGQQPVGVGSSSPYSPDNEYA